MFCSFSHWSRERAALQWLQTWEHSPTMSAATWILLDSNHCVQRWGEQGGEQGLGEQGAALGQKAAELCVPHSQGAADTGAWPSPIWGPGRDPGTLEGHAQAFLLPRISQGRRKKEALGEGRGAGGGIPGCTNV